MHVVDLGEGVHDVIIRRCSGWHSAQVLFTAAQYHLTSSQIGAQVLSHGCRRFRRQSAVLWLEPAWQAAAPSLRGVGLQEPSGASYWGATVAVDPPRGVTHLQGHTTTSC